MPSMAWHRLRHNDHYRTAHACWCVCSFVFGCGRGDAPAVLNQHIKQPLGNISTCRDAAIGHFVVITRTHPDARTHTPTHSTCTLTAAHTCTLTLAHANTLAYTATHARCNRQERMWHRAARWSLLKQQLSGVQLESIQLSFIPPPHFLSLCVGLSLPLFLALSFCLFLCLWCVRRLSHSLCRSVDLSVCLHLCLSVC